MLLRAAERGFFYFFFLFQMGVATAIFYGDARNDESLFIQGASHGPIIAIQLFLALFAALLIFRRWNRVAQATLRVWPLLLLAGLQVLSISWSIQPVLTARRDILELIMLFIAIYLGERYTTLEFARLLAQVLCIAMCVVIVLFFVAPHLVIDPGRQFALKGLSQNKNGFGFYIGLTAATLLLIPFKRLRWLRNLFIPVAFGLLLLSRSMTSVASTALIIAMLPLFLIARFHPKQRVVGYLFLTLSVMVGCILLVSYSAFFLSLLGKDDTFTGRTDVWNQLLLAIHHHPYLGYGYGSFWSGLSGESLDVTIASGWIVPEAHNAYLELWIALGIPGIAACILVFWKAFSMAIRYIRTAPGWAALWPVACILFILVHGLGESEFIYDSSFACSLFTALFTSLAVGRKEEQSGEATVRLTYPQATSHLLMGGAKSAVPRSQ